MPRELASRRPWVDVTAAMEDRPRERAIRLTAVGDDPFADVRV